MCWLVTTRSPTVEPVTGDLVTGQHILVPALATEPVRARARTVDTGSQAQLPAA